MRKSAPYGTTLNLIIIARSYSEVVIQIAIELICNGAILCTECCIAKLVIILRLTKGGIYNYFDCTINTLEASEPSSRLAMARVRKLWGYHVQRLIIVEVSVSAMTH